MKIVKPLVLSFSLFAFLGASAYAQDKAQTSQPDQNAQQSQPQSAQPPQSPPTQQGQSSTSTESAASGASRPAKDGQSQPQGQQSQQQGQVPVSQLIGKKVSDAQGEELGEIKEVVVDLQGGKVHAAVLEFGGKMGMGKKQFAFPINELKPGKSKDNYMLNVEKQKLENAEGFAKGQWSEIDAEYWGREGSQAGGATKAQGASLVRASKLKGQDLQDKSGQEVGEIKDMMVDVNSGQLGDIVVSVKGAGEAKVQAKSLARGVGDKIVLNMEAKELKSQAQAAKQAQGSSEKK